MLSSLFARLFGTALAPYRMRADQPGQLFLNRSCRERRSTFGQRVLEQLEDRHLMAGFTAGNLAVLRADAVSNNTTASMLELSGTSGALVQTISVLGTGTDAIRISGSATSTGYVARSNDGTLLTFTGHASDATGVNANTLTSRAVVAFAPDANFSIAAGYTGTSGQQTRSATTLNNSDWFIADQSGIFTNGSTAASPSGNVRGIKSFGGTVYVGQQSNTSTVIQVATVSAPSGGSITGLPGLTNSGAFQDFYLVQSGENGPVYDVLYTTLNTSATAGTIAKYSRTSGVDGMFGTTDDVWTANGTFTTTFGGFGLAAQDNGEAPGATLFVTTGNGATAANSVRQLHDAAGWNTTVNIVANDVLYTTAAGTTLKGLDFVPTPAAVPGVTIEQSAGSTNVVEGGATDTYTIKLNTQPTANVTIAIDPGTQLSVNPTLVTFTPATWDVAQTVIVSAVDDFAVEGAHTGTITHTTTSLDISYNGIVSSIIVNITDNDSAGVLLSESGGATNVTEGGATDSYTLTLLTQPTSDVTITLANLEGQVTTAPATLVFTTSNWNLPQTITVSAIDDFFAEGPHSTVITHTASSSDANYNGLVISNLTVNLTDNDVAGVDIVQSGGSTAVTEGGATDSYTLVLTSQPRENVMITLNPGTQLSVSATTVLFTGTNWNVPQTITVTAIDDTLVEGNHTGTIVHTISSADALYGALSLPSLTVQIVDNDIAPSSFTPGNLVLYRVGDGSTPLTNAATPVFIDEYQADGTFVAPLLLPATGTDRLTASGTATSEGMLNRSDDGRFLVLTGYDTDAGTASVASTAASLVPRKIGRIDAGKVIDTSTSVTSFNGNNIRSATSVDGNAYWAVGGNTGVVYQEHGQSGTGTVIASNFTNLRTAFIADGQLYVTSGASTLRLGAVGTGLPNDTGNSIVSLANVPTSTINVYQAFFADLSPAIEGVDTVYLADERTAPNGGVLKYSKDTEGNWQSSGRFEDSLGVSRGLVGGEANGIVTLYVTTTTTLYRLQDSAGHASSPSAGSFTSLATAVANTAFRGIAFAPEVTAELANPTLTVTAASALYTANPYAGASLSITNASEPIPAATFTYYVGTGTSGTNLGSTPPTNVGTYTVVASTPANAGNNAASSAPVTFQITPVAISASATATDKIYDGTTDASVTLTLAGVLPGDLVTVSGAGNFDNRNVGSGKTVNLVGVMLSGASSGNYQLEPITPPTAAITPRALTVTADAQSKTVGQADPPLSFTTSTLADGDTIGTALTGSLTRSAGEAVGSYAIFQGTLQAVNGNYEITFVTATFTINAASVAPTLTSVIVNGADSFLNSAGRSMVTSLVVTFSTPVVLSAGAFSITNIGLFSASNVVLDQAQIIVIPNATNDVYTIRFGAGSSVHTRQGTGALGNSLADGNYLLSIDPSKVSNAGGNLSGNHLFGATAADNFFRMYGDDNGDGVVNALDRAALMAALSGAANAAFDFDGNGSTSAGADTLNYAANNNKRRRLF